MKGSAQEMQELNKFATDAAVYRDHFVTQGEIQARYLPMLMFSVAWAAAFLHGMFLWLCQSVPD